MFEKNDTRYKVCLFSLIAMFSFVAGVALAQVFFWGL